MTDLFNLLWLVGGVTAWIGPCLFLMYLGERERAKRRPTTAQGDSGSAYGASSVSVMDSGVSSTASCDTHHVC